MKILMVLSYYYPHISGLSECARRLSEELVHLGHTVTVLTSQHSKELKTEEVINGVHIIRCKPIFRVGKGIAMPSFIQKASELAKKHDIVNLHLPLFEAGIFSLLIKNPIITYY